MILKEQYTSVGSVDRDFEPGGRFHKNSKLRKSLSKAENKAIEDVVIMWKNTKALIAKEVEKMKSKKISTDKIKKYVENEALKLDVKVTTQFNSNSTLLGIPYELIDDLVVAITGSIKDLVQYLVENTQKDWYEKTKYVIAGTTHYQAIKGKNNCELHVSSYTRQTVSYKLSMYGINLKTIPEENYRKTENYYYAKVSDNPTIYNYVSNETGGAIPFLGKGRWSGNASGLGKELKQMLGEVYINNSSSYAMKVVDISKIVKKAFPGLDFIMRNGDVEVNWKNINERKINELEERFGHNASITNALNSKEIQALDEIKMEVMRKKAVINSGIRNNNKIGDVKNFVKKSLKDIDDYISNKLSSHPLNKVPRMFMDRYFVSINKITEDLRKEYLNERKDFDWDDSWPGYSPDTGKANSNYNFKYTAQMNDTPENRNGMDFLLKHGPNTDRTWGEYKLAWQDGDTDEEIIKKKLKEMIGDILKEQIEDNNYKIGDIVKCFPNRNSRDVGIASQTAKIGKVKKIGRTKVTVEHPYGGWGGQKPKLLEVDYNKESVKKEPEQDKAKKEFADMLKENKIKKQLKLLIKECIVNEQFSGDKYTGDISKLNKVSKISKVKGNWVQGIIDGCQMEIKIFANGSQYGINKGRISKLWVKKDNKIVINYDRGWDIKPITPEAKAIYKKIMDATK